MTARVGDVWRYEWIYYRVRDYSTPDNPFDPPHLWAEGWDSDGKCYIIWDIEFLEKNGTFIGGDR